MSITDSLANHVVGLRYDQLPREVVEKAKHCLLDILGIMVRARFDTESSEPVTEAVRELGGATGRCTAVGNRETFTPHHAALLNGTYAHSLDFDDTHRRGSLHPGAAIIPGALAVAESVGADGKALITGMVAGYDVGCKLSVAVRPKVHYDRGFHPTATTGVFSAAAAGASILQLSAVQLKNAFGLNGSQAAGSMQFLDNGSWNKRVHVGLAAHNAIYSLVMAQKGMLGATEPIEGAAGFLHAYTDGANPEDVVEGLGERFEIEHTALKPYPSCRFTHGPIDLILEIVGAENIHVEEIERMTIGLQQKGLDIVGVPIDRKRRPQSVVDGQFSMHFTGAVAAMRRRMTWADYDRLGDPVINQLMDRTDVVHDTQAEAEYPDKFAASVTIMARGRSFHRYTDIAKGEPEKPLAWEEVVSKFHDLAAVGLDESGRTRVVEQVRNLEKLASVRDLMALFRP